MTSQPPHGSPSPDPILAGLVALTEAASARKQRSTLKNRLRPYVAAIDAAIKAGASRAEVAAELTKTGLTISPGVLGAYLTELRNGAGNSAPSSRHAAPPRGRKP